MSGKALWGVSTAFACRFVDGWQAAGTHPAVFDRQQIGTKFSRLAAVEIQRRTRLRISRHGSGNIDGAPVQSASRAGPLVRLLKKGQNLTNVPCHSILELFQLPSHWTQKRFTGKCCTNLKASTILCELIDSSVDILIGRTAWRALTDGRGRCGMRRLPSNGRRRRFSEG